jgi:lipopolysaccharide export system protein LptA
MTKPLRLLRMIPAAGLALAVSATAIATAQEPAKKATSPFQGFSSDNGQPVDVKSDSLEVHQNEQRAVFIGNVVATQGESVLRSDRLVVFYVNTQEGGPAEAGKPAAASSTAPSQASAVKRLEASGGVVVTSKDQKATGSTGVFDMTTNLATLDGNVVLNQGPNVIRGKQLVVDMKTGIARVLGGTNGLFVNTKDQTKPGSTAPKSN